jgi:hypothetical protein
MIIYIYDSPTVYPPLERPRCAQSVKPKVLKKNQYMFTSLRYLATYLNDIWPSLYLQEEN